MAKPPSVSRILRESFANLAPELRAGFDALLGGLNPFMTEVTSALNHGLTYGDNFAGEIKTIEITPPNDWITPTLSTGWANISGTNPQPLSYRKKLDGTVQVRGRVTFSTGTPSTGTEIFAFPGPSTFWMPGKREVFDVFASDGVTPQPAVVSAYNGKLSWELGGAKNLSCSGDVWWTAEDRTPPRWENPIDVTLGRKDKPYAGRPGLVQILRVIRVDSPSDPAYIPCLDWSVIYGNSKQAIKGIRIHNAWGLMPYTKYRVTLLITPE